MSIFDESDVASFRADRLAIVASTYFPSATFSDAYILQQIQAAESEVEMLLKVLLQPTAIFPYVPSEEEIAALGATPWLDEPGYDYDPEFFRAERWGFIITRQVPIISVTSINLIYPNPTSTVYQIPNDWLRIDRKYGHIRMVPASSQFVAPLGAFLMQALGGGSSIPSMIQVKYMAGLDGSQSYYATLIDAILKRALQKMIAGAFLPGSGSISADGMSQSLSVKMQDYEDQFQSALFGPKGTNTGLWTAIHGIQGMIAGVAT